MWLTEAEGGELRTADEGEALLVEEVRRLGTEAMHDWAARAAHGVQVGELNELLETAPSAPTKNRATTSRPSAKCSSIPKAARRCPCSSAGRVSASDIPLAVVMSNVKTSLHMRSHQASFVARFTALIAVLAWFVASNHCALSALAAHVAKNAAPTAECQNCPPKDSKDGSPGGMSACCKGIKAMTSTPGIAGFDAAFCGRVLCVLEVSMPPAVEALPVSVAATGPPRSVSFAEAVLSHSLQSHAPPIFG